MSGVFIRTSMMLRRFPRLYRRLWRVRRKFRKSKSEIPKDWTLLLSSFVPASSGPVEDLQLETLSSAGQFPEQVLQLKTLINVLERGTLRLEGAEVTEDQAGLASVLKERFNGARCQQLAQLFDECGSDKHRTHRYEAVYQPLIDEQLNSSGACKIVEIGTGSQNAKIMSRMEERFEVGGSCRAFQSFDSRIRVVCADYDPDADPKLRGVPFVEVDQRDLGSLVALKTHLQGADLFIDDGLHSVRANLNSLLTFLQFAKPSAFMVVEDIHPNAQAIWQLVGSLVRPSREVLFDHNYGGAGFVVLGPVRNASLAS